MSFNHKKCKITIANAGNLGDSKQSKSLLTVNCQVSIETCSANLHFLLKTRKLQRLIIRFYQVEKILAESFFLISSIYKSTQTFHSKA